MIAIIGGSGFYDFLEMSKSKSIDTPYGKMIYEIGNIEDKSVIFIPRHGKTHGLPPSKINYRANIYGAYLLGVKIILTTNAVGIINKKYKPGEFLLLEDLIDRTSNRHYDIELKSDILIPEFSSRIANIYKKIIPKVKIGGTIVVTNGPRFETAAEIKAFEKMGADVVGMTSMPELYLSNQLEIEYSSLSILTNYAAGLQETLTAEEVFDLFGSKIEEIKSILKKIIIFL